MKKAMTILLTFIMVLQLIPIPAFATEEIATAEDLKAFLENPENVTVAEGSTLTVQISAENKFTKVSVFCDGEVRIKKDVTIPSAVKRINVRITSGVSPMDTECGLFMAALCSEKTTDEQVMSAQ